MLGRTVLGRYRIIDALAQGGMGMVYLGRTEGAAGFSRPVVIKRVLPQLLGDPAIGKMFVREARILSNLRHPGIVGVVDFGEEDRAYVMVLEYVHGFDAGQWLGYLKRQRRRVPPDVALYIVAHVLDALQHAHTLKRSDGTITPVIHRDVSPGNILLDTEARVRISDFGIARVTDDASEYQTQEATFKGKFGYAHPSLLAGGEPSAATDVYAAAVVLFQLLTGTNPFRGTTAVETVNRVINLPTPRLRKYWREAPLELDQAMQRALARDPAAAHPSAQAFAEDLRSLMVRSEGDIAIDMGEILARDFQDLPGVMERPSLEERDNAWRRSVRGPDPGLRVLSTPPSADRETRRIRPGDSDSGEPTVTGPTTETLDRETPSAERAIPPPSAALAPQVKSSQKLIVLATLISAMALAGVGVLFFTKQKPAPSTARYVVVSKDQGSPDSTGDTNSPRTPNLDAPSPGPSEAASAAGTAEEKAPLPTAAPGPGKTEAAGPRKPDPRYFTQVFARRQGAVQACFATAAAGDDVSLQILFSVDTKGHVTAASLSPGSLAGTPSGQCVLRVARGVSFGPLTEPATFRIPVQAKRR
jgi:serine/threonine-protein kinase